MSEALMLEALRSSLAEEQHPKKRHYLPSVSEITVAINQISSAKKAEREKMALEGSNKISGME